MADGEGWGGRLKARARELGLTDSEVARRLDITQRRYSSWVNETREPNFRDLLKVCAVLDLTPDLVLGVSEPDTETDLERRALSAIRAMRPETRHIALAALEGIAAGSPPARKRTAKASG